MRAFFCMLAVILVVTLALLNGWLGWVRPSMREKIHLVINAYQIQRQKKCYKVRHTQNVLINMFAWKCYDDGLHENGWKRKRLELIYYMYYVYVNIIMCVCIWIHLIAYIQSYDVYSTHSEYCCWLDEYNTIQSIIQRYTQSHIIHLIFFYYSFYARQTPTQSISLSHSLFIAHANARFFFSPYLFYFQSSAVFTYIHYKQQQHSKLSFNVQFNLNMIPVLFLWIYCLCRFVNSLWTHWPNSKVFFWMITETSCAVTVYNFTCTCTLMMSTSVWY